MRRRLEQRTVGMRIDNETILSYVTNTRGVTRHVTLIDPDKQAPQTAADRACVAIEAVSYTHLTLPTKRIV